MNLITTEVFLFSTFTPTQNTLLKIPPVYKLGTPERHIDQFLGYLDSLKTVIHFVAGDTPYNLPSSGSSCQKK